MKLASTIASLSLVVLAGADISDFQATCSSISLSDNVLSAECLLNNPTSFDLDFCVENINGTLTVKLYNIFSFEIN
jgi:hypothetical protein